MSPTCSSSASATPLEAAIAEHERLAAELRLPAYAWYVPLWRAALALLAGHVDEASRLSAEGERIGRAAHDDNAKLLFEVQRIAINHARGQLTDEDAAARRWHIEHSPAGAAWRAAAAITSFALGDADARRGAARARGGRARLRAARRQLAVRGGDARAYWPHCSSDAAAAAAVYPRLLPYGHRTVVAGRASYCAGSASLPLGLLAATLGDRPAAVAHLEEAVRRNDALGAVPYAAGARQALARLVEDPAVGAGSAGRTSRGIY